MHMYGTRRVRDLNLAHARVDLVVPNRKLRYGGCRTIRTEGRDFLAPYRRHRPAPCPWPRAGVTSPP